MWLAAVIIFSILAIITGAILWVTYDSRHYFKWLRKKMRTWDVYEIRRSERLFGSFWDSAEPNAVIRAADSKHALERYFDKYRRRYNEYHAYDNKILRETTYGWGVFQVKNTRTGFKRYFH